MALMNMVNTIKELFPDYVVLIRIGTFYEAYNDDSFIISYLLKYKIKKLIDGSKACGFPTVSINKVKYVLENKNINYILVDRKHNYEEEEKMNYKKKNKYNEILTKSKEEIDRLDRIEKVRNYLLSDSSKLVNVESLLYEG